MKDHEYFVYIMSSRSGTLYIGMTNSIYRRAMQHKSGQIEGFASKYHCNRLVYYESFDNVHRAIGSTATLGSRERNSRVATMHRVARRPRGPNRRRPEVEGHTPAGGLLRMKPHAAATGSTTVTGIIEVWT